jgi:hypothetical protein
VTAAYDLTCPGCAQPTSPDDLTRVCCGGCATYHHAACWQKKGCCRACGVGETVADRSNARHERDAVLRIALFSVTVLGCVAFAVLRYTLPLFAPDCLVAGLVVCGVCVAAMPILNRLTR